MDDKTEQLFDVAREFTKKNSKRMTLKANIKKLDELIEALHGHPI